MSFSEKVFIDKSLKGLTTFVIPTQIKDVVTISGSLKGGEYHAKSYNSKIATLSGSMLDKGTLNKTKHEISETLESLGADISFVVSNHHINFTAHCLSKDLETVITLLSDLLQNPSYKDEELSVLKKRLIGNLKRSKEDTKKQASINFLSELYPENHPNARYSIDDTIKMVENVSSEDIKQFHQQAYGLGSFNVVAAGDVDPDKFNKLIIGELSNMQDQGINLKIDTPAPKESLQNEVRFNIIDKTSCDMFIGQTVNINEDHSEYYSLMMGIYILGGNFSARLMQTVRDKQGLTYGIGSGLAGCSYGVNGHWYTWGTFSPELLNEGFKATSDQIKSWYDNGVNAEELSSKKTTFTGSFQVGLDTTSGLVDRVLTNAEKGRELDFLDNYNELINDLDIKKINEAIKKYIKPENLTKSVAGSID